MKKIILSAIVLTAALSVNQLNAQCTDLFFSEYIEGSSNNKAIEVYNPTSSKIGLGNYEVRIYNNGGAIANNTLTFSATDSIDAYDVYVISNSASSLTGITSNSDVTSAIAGFNGDDAIELYKISTTSSIDVFGVIGSDPGTSWTITGTNSVSGSTANNTLVRDPSVQQGQTNWTIGVVSEWLVFPQDAVDSIGAHISICSSGPVVSPTASFSVTNTTCNGGSDGAIDLTASSGTAPYTYVWSNAATTEDITGLTAGTYTVTITDAFSATKVDSAVVTEPNAINVSISQISPVTCNGNSDGILNATASNGAGGYSYLWSNAATTPIIINITAGTYTVTVTDANSCTAAQSFVLTGPPAIGITSVITNTTTVGGSDGAIDVSTTNGIAPLTYLWSNSSTTEDISGLLAGAYTITITDAGSCTNTASFTVTGPAPLTASISTQTNVVCNGTATGSATVSPLGGLLPYTFAWSNAATTSTVSGLIAGTYTVTISDANTTTTTATATITEPAALVASVVVDSNVSCNGLANGGLMASATGGTGTYTYLWSNAATTASITGLSAGSYSVTITDANNCSNTATGTVTEPLALSVSDVITNVTATGLSDGSIDITVSGGTTGYAYLWSNSSTTEDLTGLTAGIYSVTITDANLCTITANYTITQPAGALANLVITEINYNGPESGTDSTEFIEFQNIGATSVDLTGYSFVEGVSHSFTGGIVLPGDFFVLAYDSSSFRNTFGFDADDIWNSGGLSNGGEDITIVDNFGRTIDSVDYDDGGTWPSGFSAGQPDGGGASIILCDSSFDNNLGSSWSAAISPVTGVIVNGFQVLANAGTGGVCSLPMSIVMVNDSNVTCNAGVNGGASVNVTGGLSPINYSWSNAATTASIAGIAAGTYTVTVTDALSATLVDSVVILEPTAITVTSSVTNASANGLTDGAIDITVSGGTTPYSFLWSNATTTEDLTAIGAGTYTVTISDGNACTSVKTFTVTQPTSLSLVDVITNVSCNGGNDGTISLTASGGVSPYAFLWSNANTTSSITGLSAGTYNVTVTDANAITSIGSYVVTEPTAIQIAGVITNATTFGGSDGSVDITVSGGTPVYTYLWSNTAITEDISTLSAATYTVTVTDANGCTAVDNFVITQPAGALASLVITEINYNGPEAGVDSTEFIEFVNTGSTPVDLTGYSFVEGISHTFTSGSIASGQYMVIAFDSSGFRNTFGFNADFVWNLGGLSNGGEDITIVDNFNRTIDSVDFDDSAPWPSGFAAGQPDGGGASLVLCDSTADNNNGANWFAATSPVAGQIVNGLQVFANPGVGAPCLVSLAATISVDSTVSCNGLSDGGLTVNVTSGTTPISFVWSNAATTASISGLAAGTYTVTITDGNSATLVDSAVITEPAIISITSVVVDQTPAGNDGSIDLTVSGGTPGYDFLWSTADTTEDISGLNAGVYTVTITDTNNCVFVDSVTVGLSTSVQEATLQNNLLIYPNPSNGVFTIETIAQYDEIRILDITGKVLFMTEEYTLRNKIDLTNQQRGIYFIAIQGESGRVVKKVIVN